MAQDFVCEKHLIHFNWQKCRKKWFQKRFRLRATARMKLASDWPKSFPRNFSNKKIISEIFYLQYFHLKCDFHIATIQNFILFFLYQIARACNLCDIYWKA